jgi:hypothetical protein
LYEYSFSFRVEPTYSKFKFLPIRFTCIFIDQQFTYEKESSVYTISSDTTNLFGLTLIHNGQTISITNDGGLILNYTLTTSSVHYFTLFTTPIKKSDANFQIY